MVCFAFAIRFFFVLLVFRSVAAPTPDHNEFGWEMGWVARSIFLFGHFSSPFFPLTGPTALVPPLYPYLLASIFRGFGLYTTTSALVALGVNSALSALTCIPVFYLARHAGGSRTATVAGWLWVVYPFSIYFASTRIWDYSLTASLFAFTWWIAHLLHRNPTMLSSLAFGALYGITALSNPSVLTIYPVVVSLILWKIVRRGDNWLKPVSLIIVGTAFALLPWTIRNYHVLHVPVPVRNGFWLECWAGNHGDVSSDNPASAHPASNSYEMDRYKQLGEVKYFDEKKTMALAFVSSHPFETILVSARRTVRFWTGFWSMRAEYLHDQPLDLPNLFFCSTVSGLMFFGLWRFWERSWRAALPSVLLVLIFPIPYYMTHASMDYRQPIEPMIIVLVAIACCKDQSSKHARMESSERTASYPELIAT